ncbi:MAG: metal ABC transporter permease [Planctomycetes bacterium]|jgi:zinc/manganese transport system permease protein|nr:metal ABC transporter permease [Planctomycetota bacterium]
MSLSTLLWIMLPAFCECLVLVGIHSYLGLHVIKRKVIFVDLAFAQIAALGTLIAFLFGIPPHTAEAFVFAVFLTAIGAAVFALCRFRRDLIPQEAVIGLVYAITAATAILLIDKAPHGAEHLKEIMTGSILWVKWPSVALAAVVYAAVGAFHYVFRRPFLLISEAPERAFESGLRVRFWDFLFYLSFGVVITLSVDVAGVLIVFVFLVAPAILAILVSDRLVVQLLTGWGLGVVVTALGLVLAYVKDLSTGPAVIAVYGVALLVAAGILHVVRAPRRGAALGRALLVTAGFAAAGAALVLGGRLLGARYREAVAHERPASEPEPAGEANPGEEAEEIVRALEADPAAAADRAVRFLTGDPPPFFRATVVSKLIEALGADPGFAEDEPMDSPANRRALEAVRELLRPPEPR